MTLLGFPNRPKTHVTGNTAVLAVQNSIPVGWIFRETGADYGIDCEIEIVDKGAVTGAIIKGQIKGTSSQHPTIRNSVAVPLQNVRYWLGLPVPVVIFRVVEKPKMVLWINVRDYVAERENIGTLYNRTSKKTFSFNFRGAYKLPKDSKHLRDLAFEHQNTVSQVYQSRDDEFGGKFIGLIDFALNFNCDIDLLVKWYRENATLEQLAGDMPINLWIKEQIEEDPNFIPKVRKMAKEFARDWDKRPAKKRVKHK